LQAIGHGVMAIEREASISNREGLHFRPIMQFVDLASKFRSKITVHVEDRQADSRSAMELLMLVAVQGTRIKIVADGADAEQAADALVALVNSGFNEPK
jgi:phosphotransferase system HPr (HPr) family protein